MSILKRNVQKKAYKLVFGQLLGVLLLSLLILLFKNLQSALSALAGGLAYGLSNLLFVFLAFRYVGAREMSKFISAFMAGEALKLILSACLLIIIVKTLPVNLLFMLIGLIGAIVSFWISSLFNYCENPIN